MKRESYGEKESGTFSGDSEVHHQCAKFECSNSVIVFEILGLLTWILVEEYIKLRGRKISPEEDLKLLKDLIKISSPSNCKDSY